MNDHSSPYNSASLYTVHCIYKNYLQLSEKPREIQSAKLLNAFYKKAFFRTITKISLGRESRVQSTVLNSTLTQSSRVQRKVRLKQLRQELIGD